MIDELKILLPSFLGRRGHVRCMAHTVNLTAKSILRPFEPKCKESENQENGAEDSLERGLEMEELRAELQDIEENRDSGSDNVESFVNVLEEMTDVEKEQ